MWSGAPLQQKRCQCGNEKIIRVNDESPQLKPVEVFFAQDAHADAFTALKLNSSIADFSCLDSLLKNMVGSEAEQVIPDSRFRPLGEAWCEGFLRLHPPCVYCTYESYLELLAPKLLTLFKRMNCELTLTASKALPDNHVRLKVPPRKYAEEYSADVACHIERMSVYEQKIKKTFSDLYPLERLNHLFIPFTFMVNILEKDMQKRSPIRQVNSRNPLVMDLIWDGMRAWDAESITNNTTRSIFDFYTDSWHNRVQPKFLKTIARLIAVMSQAARFADNGALNRQSHPEDPSNLASPEKCIGRETPPFRELSSRALNEIENCTRKIRPHVVVQTNNVGSICIAFATVLASSLKNRCSCERYCHFIADAVSFLQPVWLRLHVSSQLLKLEPTAEALKRCVELESSGLTTQRSAASELASNLRTILLSSAEGTFAEVWRKTNHCRKVNAFPKRAKLSPGNLSREELEVDEFMNRLRDLRSKKGLLGAPSSPRL